MIDGDMAVSQGNYQIVSIHVHFHHWRHHLNGMKQLGVVEVGQEPVKSNLKHRSKLTTLFFSAKPHGYLLVLLLYPTWKYHDVLIP